MREGRRLQDLLVRLYDSATGLASWDTFLSCLGDAVSAPTATLFSQLPGKPAAFFGATGVDPEVPRVYRERFAIRNVLMDRGAALHVPGTVRTTETICRRDDLLRSEYYNEFLRPNDLRYSLAITAVRDGSRAVHLALFRSHDHACFGRPEMEALGRLYPHLRRAVEVHLRLAQKDQFAGAFEQIVDGHGSGVALVDAEGKVVYANHALERLVQANDGLVLTRAGLSATLPSAARALRAAVADAIRGGAGDAVFVARESGQPAFRVVVSPILRRLPFLANQQAMALVLVSDPGAAIDANVISLQQTYGFTRAEARIASRLASGLSVRDIAEQLDISIHTARTHVKRILAKTGTGRQAQLVRRILLALPHRI